MPEATDWEVVMSDLRSFQVGNVYTTRSACDYDCIFSFTVTARTAKTVTIKSNFGESKRRISERDGSECIYPLGSYSMAPSLKA